MTNKIYFTEEEKENIYDKQKTNLTDINNNN